MMEERFLSLLEVRQMFAVSRSTVWRWIDKSGLKCVQIGGVIRVRESDLRAFVEKHELRGFGAEPQT